jgi:hypothetical protein
LRLFLDYDGCDHYDFVGPTCNDGCAWDRSAFMLEVHRVSLRFTPLYAEYFAFRPSGSWIRKGKTQQVHLFAGLNSTRTTGLEPATSGSTVRCSNQLSYVPNGIRRFTAVRPVFKGIEACGLRRSAAADRGDCETCEWTTLDSNQ